jgi:hypothetical protein
MRITEKTRLLLEMGQGNFGHAGRPGHQGGSLPKGEGEPFKKYTGKGKHGWTEITVRSLLEDNGVYPDSFTFSKKTEIFTFRKSYFYRNELAGLSYINAIKNALPGVNIIDSGEYQTSFRGNGTIEQIPHWWVKFKIPENFQPK